MDTALSRSIVKIGCTLSSVDVGWRGGIPLEFHTTIRITSLRAPGLKVQDATSAQTFSLPDFK